MPDADWLERHVRLLRSSYRHWTGQDLVPAELDDRAAASFLDLAGFAVISHGTGTDPVFNYANRTGLALFERSWEEFTALPSRLSAEPQLREDRDRLLLRVAQQGYIDDYSGVRVSKHGKRFLVRNAVVWNLVDAAGAYLGQAAQLREWEHL